VVRVDLAESQTKPQVIRISAWCIFFIGVLIIIEFALLKSLLFAMLYKRIDCRNWWVDLGSSTAVVRELLWIPWRSWSCFVLMRASIRKIKLVMWHFVKWNLNVQYKNQGIVRMNWLLLEFWFGDGYHVVIDVRVTCIIFSKCRTNLRAQGSCDMQMLLVQLLVC